MQQVILVTGAAGFIGSHLCDALLANGNFVIGIDNFDPFYDRSVKEENLSLARTNSAFQFIEGDAGDHLILNQCQRKPDLVVHLAAKAGVQPSLKAPLDYIQANIHVTNSLLEWMKINEVKKFVFASSSSVYGHTAIVPFREGQGTDHPISPYAFTKKSCELINYTYHQLYGFSIINLRFFTVYGERQRPDLAIHKFVAAISNKRPITMYGDGDTSRDYTYWADTVQGIQQAIEYLMDQAPVYLTLNLGNENPVALKTLIQRIGEAMEVEPAVVREDKKPGDVDITFADISEARRLLGYTPATSLEEGLKKFISWYRRG